MNISHKTFVGIAAAVALSITGIRPVDAAGSKGGRGGKKSVVSQADRSSAQNKRSSKARSRTKHRSSNAAAGRKSTKRTSNSNKTGKSKSKVKRDRPDVALENELSMMADEANNRVELPQNENADMNEIETEREIDDASANLMGTDNQTEDQADDGD